MLFTFDSVHAIDLPAALGVSVSGQYFFAHAFMVLSLFISTVDCDFGLC